MASSRPYPFQWVEVPDEELKDAIPNAAGGYIRLVLGFRVHLWNCYKELKWHLIVLVEYVPLDLIAKKDNTVCKQD